MARRRTTPTHTGDLPPLKVQGKTFLFVSDKRYTSPERYVPLVEAEGGKVVTEVTPALDFILEYHRAPRG